MYIRIRTTTLLHCTLYYTLVLHSLLLGVQECTASGCVPPSLVFNLAIDCPPIPPPPSPFPPAHPPPPRPPPCTPPTQPLPPFVPPAPPLTPSPPTAPKGLPWYHDVALYVGASVTAPGDGSAALPFGSLQECVDVLGAQPQPPAYRACLLLGGEHRWNTTAVIEGLTGDADTPYVIGAAAGALPTVDGTVDIVGPWSWVDTTHALPNGSVVVGGHWSAPLPAGAA